ncbi:hypothetical protein OEZ86_007051 [Tetradesmus obliquus]|nr:hypothetical protein OEZ86_007051 [Tetradesmus obliquus]
MESLCSTIGATYVTLPASPQPTCRLSVQHQGVERFADVYFPSDYSASSPAPLWLILHGLYNVKPAADGGPPPTGGLDHIKRAAEHVAGSMGINKGWLAKEAILVYPDSGGKLPGFQMWNSGYWQCPYKSHPSHCMDSDTDDVGFLEALTKALQAKLPSKPNDVYALGFSNGGMILQTLLCKSPYLRSTLAGAALVNTVLREAYLDEECVDVPPPATANSSSSSSQQQQRKVPLVFIHGMQDSLFPFFEGSSSATGDVLLSTLEMADAWAASYGCSGSSGSTPLVLLAGEGVACRDLCTAAAAGSSNGDRAAAGQPPAALWLCGLQQTGHDWTPFKADLAWTFFTQRQQHTAAMPEPKFPTWQGHECCSSGTAAGHVSSSGLGMGQHVHGLDTSMKGMHGIELSQV